MNAHRVLQRVKGKHLNIELPETFRDAEVEVIVLKNEPQAKEERLTTVRRFQGILKNTSYQVSEDEWYKQ